MNYNFTCSLFVRRGFVMQEKDGLEIEKKYLVSKLPEDLEHYPAKQIEQAYLCVEPTVRIRRYGDEYVLTYKSRQGVLQMEHVKACREIEMPLTKEAYEHLCKKADGRVIIKKRYHIPLSDGLTAELDIFEGELAGLVLAEVEFPSQSSIQKFCIPDWFGQDVSDDICYTNSYLSLADQKELWGLTKKLR